MLLKPFARANWILDAGWLAAGEPNWPANAASGPAPAPVLLTGLYINAELDGHRRQTPSVSDRTSTRSKGQEIENSRITLYNVQPQGLGWLKAPGTRRVDLVESLDGRQAISFWPRGGATNVIVIIVVVAMAAVNGHCANLQPLVVVVVGGIH